MWSHYGDSHKGMCLEYDFGSCDDEIYNMLMPIIYVNTPQRINFVSSDNDSYQECNALSSVLIKSNEWAYEKEWRLIKCLNEHSDEKYFHRIPFLKHIYIGACAADNGIVNDVVYFAHSKNIPISKMVRRDDSFYLNSKPIKVTQLK
jgi:hypothetical protein